MSFEILDQEIITHSFPTLAFRKRYFTIKVRGKKWFHFKAKRREDLKFECNGCEKAVWTFWFKRKPKTKWVKTWETEGVKLCNRCIVKWKILTADELKFLLTFESLLD